MIAGHPEAHLCERKEGVCVAKSAQLCGEYYPEML